MLTRSILVIFTLFLTACASNPLSYLPTGNIPIVNVEAEIDEKIEVNAQSTQLKVTNRTEWMLSLTYKLFWYDDKGVTQTFSEPQGWKMLILSPKQSQELLLVKPNEESVNYRVYLRGQR